MKIVLKCVYIYAYTHNYIQLVDMLRLIQNGFPVKIWQYALGNGLATDHLALFLGFFSDSQHWKM